MSDAAEQIFRRLRNCPSVQRFKATRTPEDLHLEFKRLASPASRDDLHQLSECLSAFSNADGGVVVYGLVTGKGADTNIAVAAEPIERPREAAADLRTELPSLVNPLPDGVDVHPVGARQGFVIILVPASSAPPHMATRSRRYFRRHGSSNLQMEHYEVADMFGRRLSPRLKVVAHRRSTLPAREHESDAVLVQLLVRNDGKAAARDTLVFVQCSASEGVTVEPQDGVILDVTGFNPAEATGTWRRTYSARIPNIVYADPSYLLWFVNLRIGRADFEQVIFRWNARADLMKREDGGFVLNRRGEIEELPPLAPMP